MQIRRRGKWRGIKIVGRGTISESRVGEPRNPISVLFYDRCGRQREGVVFSRLLCSPIQDVVQRQRKDDGNAKASMQTAAGAMLRVCNSTNKGDRYLHGRRNIRVEKHRL